MATQFVMSGGNKILEPSVVPQVGREAYQGANVQQFQVAVDQTAIDPRLASAPMQFLKTTQPYVDDMVKGAKTIIAEALKADEDATAQKIVNAYTLASNEYMANLSTITGQDGVEAAKRAREDLISIGNKVLDQYSNGNAGARNAAKIRMEELLTNNSLKAQNHLVKSAYEYKANELKSTINNQVQDASLHLGQADFKDRLNQVTATVDQLLEHSHIPLDSEQAKEMRTEATNKVFKDSIDYLIDNEQIGAAKTYLNQYRAQMTPKTYLSLLSRAQSKSKTIAARNAGVAAANAEAKYWRTMTSNIKKINEQMFAPRTKVESDARINALMQQEVMRLGYQKKVEREIELGREMTPDELKAFNDGLKTDTDLLSQARLLATSQEDAEQFAFKQASRNEGNFDDAVLTYLKQNDDKIQSGQTPWEIMPQEVRNNWNAKGADHTPEAFNKAYYGLYHVNRPETNIGRSIRSLSWEQMQAEGYDKFLNNEQLARMKFIHDFNMSGDEATRTLQAIQSAKEAYDKGQVSQGSMLWNSTLSYALPFFGKDPDVSKFNKKAKTGQDGEQTKLIFDVVQRAVYYQQKDGVDLATAFVKAKSQLSAEEQLQASKADAKYALEVQHLASEYPLIDIEEIASLYEKAILDHGARKGIDAVAIITPELEREQLIRQKEQRALTSENTYNAQGEYLMDYLGSKQ